jgi:hypothetical protein
VRRLAVPADIQRGDAVSEDRPSGPRDALSVRTLAKAVPQAIPSSGGSLRLPVVMKLAKLR